MTPTRNPSSTSAAHTLMLGLAVMDRNSVTYDVGMYHSCSALPLKFLSAFFGELTDDNQTLIMNHDLVHEASVLEYIIAYLSRIIGLECSTFHISDARINSIKPKEKMSWIAMTASCVELLEVLQPSQVEQY